MADETGTATPATGGEASSAPASVSSEGASGQSGQASAAAGNALGSGGDAGAQGGDATATAAAVTAAQFPFLKRGFRDQKHAEEVLGSEIGMTRGLQRQNAELEKRAATLEAELNALRPLVVERSAPGRTQGVREGAQAPGEPKSFAQGLADSGELNFIAKMFADPEMGPAHAMFRLADLLEQHNAKQFDGLRDHLTGEITTRDQRSALHTTTARTLTAAVNLATQYPELDNDNKSEEAEQAQQAILQIIQELPGGPQWLATDATECLTYAAERYRRMHGTPIFAQAPGTSGSPSSRAAAAAEAGSTAAALDGSGVPRQRTNGQPESFVDKIKRENREINKRMATTPSGRPLGFELPA
jgi:hypothetical protein